MRTSPDYREIFCKRLRAMRLASGLSQKKLGILAGIDEFAASTRIKRYERGIHEVEIQTRPEGHREGQESSSRMPA